MTDVEIWTQTRNGKSFKALWQNAEPEIKALLADDEGNIVDGKEIDFRGFHYKAAANYYGKDYIFRTESKAMNTADTIIQPTSYETQPVEPTTAVSETVTVSAGTVPTTILPSLNISAFEDIQAVKIKEVKDWLDKGYVPLGNTWAEMYKDGLVGLGKPRVAA